MFMESWRCKSGSLGRRMNSMKAILSDIHSNLEALLAVLDDVAHHHVEATYCLGDVIVYGPNPRECLDLAREWKLTLLGNFEQAVLVGNVENFGSFIARRSVLWTRQLLQAPVPDCRTADRRWEFLAELPQAYQEGEFQFVHGSARNPLNEYV